MPLVEILVFVGAYVVGMGLFDRDEAREIIEKCISGLKFIRKGRKDNYIYYQFMTDGKEIKTEKLRMQLEDYLGKPVRVFFNRVLTVRVYKKNLPSKWELEGNEQGICLGYGLDGKVFHDFNKYPHLAIAGSTGYGKTNLIQTLMKQFSQNDEIILIDLKNSREFRGLRSAGTIEEAYNVLGYVDDVMKEGGRDSGRIFVIIDEAHELIPKSHMTRKEGQIYRECQDIVSKIARMGRSLGVHLIFATQYPTSDVLPREIKQNAEARVIFRLPTEVASRVALDESGAERLPAGLKGRAIYKTDVYKVIQTPIFSGFEKGEIENVSFREKKKKGIRDYIEIG
mgnify:CR=1 FL=1